MDEILRDVIDDMKARQSDVPVSPERVNGSV
jgi:hypothetical protein